MKRIIFITLLILAFTITATAQDCLVKQMRQHAKGLTYMSEADSTVYVFSMQARTKRALDFLRKTKGQRSQRFDDWASNELERMKAAGENEEGMKARTSLFDLIQTYLTDVKVVKMGKDSIYQLYVFGRDLCGNVVGLRMKAVET